MARDSAGGRTKTGASTIKGGLMSASEDAARWGEIGRDTGAQRSLWDRDWTEDGERTIRDLAESGKDFTADAVSFRCGPGPSNGAMGALFLQASRAGLIECVGVRSSSRLQRHSGLQRVWRGAHS